MYCLNAITKNNELAPSAVLEHQGTTAAKWSLWAWKNRWRAVGSPSKPARISDVKPRKDPVTRGWTQTRSKSAQDCRSWTRPAKISGRNHKRAWKSKTIDFESGWRPPPSSLHFSLNDDWIKKLTGPFRRKETLWIPFPLPKSPWSALPNAWSSWF